MVALNTMVHGTIWKCSAVQQVDQPHDPGGYIAKAVKVSSTQKIVMADALKLVDMATIVSKLMVYCKGHYYNLDNNPRNLLG